MPAAYFVDFKKAGLTACNTKPFLRPWWETVPVNGNLSRPFWELDKTPAPVQALTPAETEKAPANFLKRFFKGF